MHLIGVSMLRDQGQRCSCSTLLFAADVSDATGERRDVANVFSAGLVERINALPISKEQKDKALLVPTNIQNATGTMVLAELEAEFKIGLQQMSALIGFGWGSGNELVMNAVLAPLADGHKCNAKALRLARFDDNLNVSVGDYRKPVPRGIRVEPIWKHEVEAIFGGRPPSARPSPRRRS
jgi:hypothetical protein